MFLYFWFVKVFGDDKYGRLYLFLIMMFIVFLNKNKDKSKDKVGLDFYRDIRIRIIEFFVILEELMDNGFLVYLVLLLEGECRDFFKNLEGWVYIRVSKFEDGDVFESEIQ